MRRRPFYGWYIVAAGMGIGLWVSTAWIYGVQVFFTPIIQEFGWSRALISGAFSLQRIEGAAITPFHGFLVDRLGPRKMVLGGSFVMGLGLILLSFMQSLWMFYAGVLVISVGLSAGETMPRNWAIIHWFRRLRGLALGLGASGPVLSGPLVFLVVVLVQAYGWRTAFLLLGLLTWALCIPLGFVFRSRPEAYGYLPDGDLKPPVEVTAVEEARRGATTADTEGMTVGEALRSKAFWFLVVIFSAHSAGVSALLVHLVPYFETIQFSTTQAVSVLGFFTVLSVFGRLGGGWALDSLDRRLVLAGLLGCQALGFLFLANITAYWQVVPFALLYGTAFGGMMPARSFLIGAFFGSRNFGALQGLAQSATVVGSFSAPVLMGLLFDLTGSYVPALYLLAAVAMLAIPFAVVLRSPSRQSGGLS